MPLIFPVCQLKYENDIITTLCLTWRMTVTSARIPEEDSCYRARNMYVLTR